MLIIKHLRDNLHPCFLVLFTWLVAMQCFCLNQSTEEKPSLITVYVNDSIYDAYSWSDGFDKHTDTITYGTIHNYVYHYWTGYYLKKSGGYDNSIRSRLDILFQDPPMVGSTQTADVQLYLPKIIFTDSLKREYSAIASACSLYIDNWDADGSFSGHSSCFLVRSMDTISVRTVFTGYRR